MFSELLNHYETGPLLLVNSVASMTEQQLDAKPVAGKWSTRQVVCHLADFEPIYADRMKRVIAEREPVLMEAAHRVLPAIWHMKRANRAKRTATDNLRSQTGKHAS
ncbi:MAG: DinB family protein [Planctomycetaceae bacterium]